MCPNSISVGAVMDIILFGNQKEIGLQKFLIEHLIKRYDLTAINGSSLLSSGRSSDILLLETDSLRCVNSRSCLIILKNKANLGALRNIQGNVNVLVNSGNQRQVEAVARLGLPAITCGMSHKDTLTFSSIGADSSVISLQRPIDLGGGNIREPLELPIQHSSPFEHFPLFCLAAVRILMDDTDNLKLEL